MTWLASTPAPIDMTKAKEAAKTRYDDAAAERIHAWALDIYRELRGMHSVYRARNVRATAVSRMCGLMKTTEFAKSLDVLIRDPAPAGGDRDGPVESSTIPAEMMSTATLTLRQWAMVSEALTVYLENLRADDDPGNNALADEVDHILIPEGRWD